MKPIAAIISKYIIRTIVPYFLFSWLLLSVILFVQQAGRFSDIFFSVNIPASLVWQLMIALVPNVVAFTCPMAVLVGTVIGLAKMQGDSELVAIRAAGVGNLQITLPIAVLGLLLSIFAFVVNLEGVPLAAKLVRQVALKTAIQKLESPIEPGIFNTEVPGYTIFVKSGDQESGRWQDIFVYQEDQANRIVRFINADEGRIDISEEISELVLDNASVTTIPMPGNEGKYVSENLGNIRIAIRTRRNEMIERLSSLQTSPEELGLSQLSEYAAARQGKDRVEAQILWQRRIILSFTPLFFCLFASAMMLRTNRGGRGYGTLMALLVLLVYYLLAFLGEQLARLGIVNAFVAGLIPILMGSALIVWLNFAKRVEFLEVIFEEIRSKLAGFRPPTQGFQKRSLFVDLTTGIRDLDLLGMMLKYFFLTLGFLMALSVIFTGFELWKFAGAISGGVWLLAKYLIYLLPFIYLQYLATTAAMLAVLATYVIKSRQNEIVTWIGAGLSIYRLLIPSFAAAVFLGLVNWGIQEWVLPVTNPIQDDLRTQIRSMGTVRRENGRYWVYDDGKIITFTTDASDNVTELHSPTFITPQSPEQNSQLLGPTRSVVYRAGSGKWLNGKLSLGKSVEKLEISSGSVIRSVTTQEAVPFSKDPLFGITEKPSHLSRKELRSRREASESDTEKQIYAVALEKRYATPFLPLVIALFSAPFGLSLARRGRVLAIGGAIGVWLLFIGVGSFFEQLGLNGSLSASMVVWPPVAIFAAVGLYMLARVRT